MKQRISIAFTLLFVVVNLLLIWGHFIIFRSSVPFAAAFTALVHILILIFFPYSKLLKNEN